MSRPLRIAYPNAWYHVMNRGRRAETIFADKDDYGLFTDLLKETAELWNIRIAAYCLMPNHYHLLIQTPDANISRGMRHLNGVYTQRYNRRHRCDGQLFRGRYKSILIDSDSYLLQVVRYIHRNPLQAEIVKHLDAYPWSSHKGYLSVSKKWDWLFKNRILSILAKNRKEWLRHYRQWVLVAEEDDVSRAINQNRWPVCLGPQAFIDRIKERYGGKKIYQEIPSIRELVPDVDRICAVVCAFYGVEMPAILKMRRGQLNEPRNMAIYLVRKLRRDTLGQIASAFEIANDSTVSSVVERMHKRLERDQELCKRLLKMEIIINKSQERT